MDEALVGMDATVNQYGKTRNLFRGCCELLGYALFSCILIVTFSVVDSRSAQGDITLGTYLEVRANSVSRWQQGTSEATFLQGDCVISLDGKRWDADLALLIADGSSGEIRCKLAIVQSESDWSNGIVPPKTIACIIENDPVISASHYVSKPLVADRLSGLLEDGDGNVWLAGPTVKTTQFQENIGIKTSSSNTIPGSKNNETGLQFMVGGGTRSVEIVPRGSSSLPQVETINRPELGETIIVARGGMTVLIRDVTAQLPSGDQMQLGTVSISADRVVGWLPLVANLFSGAEQLSDAQGELYLEGDIVFKQGDRIIYADSMYYNVGMERGLVLDAEAITPIPNSMGIIRLKADVMQQVAKGNFIAFDAAITSSRLGVPRYWLQSQQLTLREQEQVETDPSGGSIIRHESFVDSRNNFVYLSGVPVLYWPKFSSSLDRPTSYVSSVGISSDGVFGTQYLLDLDLIQLLGIQSAASGIDWDLSLDYFTDRGFAVGTNLDYHDSSLFGADNLATGLLDAWFIRDSGTDTLGSLRRDLTPETRNRGRTLLRHRQTLGTSSELTAEIGWVSDRNFLEQFLENEWDQDPDHRSEIHLRRYHHSHLLDFSVSARLNDFYTTTEKLPQLDHYLLGGSLLGERLTVSGHTKVGYQRLNQADAPVDPAEAGLYSPVPGQVSAKGLVATTRQEVSLPFQVGPVRLVPNLSGEAAHYGQDVAGQPITRLLGQAGVTASLSAWKTDPAIQSALLNVRGLAHKVEWVAGYHYAASDVNLDQLPLYDSLDDNAQEQFRSRYITSDFGGVLDPQFDPRYFALRQGFQWLVASPSDVIAADLQQFRLGLHQRWQTKRGLQGKERIVDLLQFDIDTSLFNRSDQHNFSETIGPTTYNLAYHVGDRVAFLSDGYFDFFSSGLQTISAGLQTSRPSLGEFYVGLLSIRGPISSTVARANFDYRLNEKWIASAGTAYDFDETGNIGQTLALTRIGESMLLRVGVNVDEGRDNVGVGFSIEPRFWPSPRLGRLGGGLISPPGIDGLE